MKESKASRKDRKEAKAQRKRLCSLRLFENLASLREFMLNRPDGYWVTERTSVRRNKSSIVSR